LAIAAFIISPFRISVPPTSCGLVPSSGVATIRATKSHLIQKSLNFVFQTDDVTEINGIQAPPFNEVKGGFYLLITFNK
ncbi:MAG: hypothetical protein AB1861_30080, partial [Cyanobacteriota bacterium]